LDPTEIPRAMRMTSDGNIVVGYHSAGNFTSRGFVWKNGSTFQAVMNYLRGRGHTESLGSMSSTQTLTRDVSGDGRVIVGDNVEGFGFGVGWVAVTPSP